MKILSFNLLTLFPDNEYLFEKNMLHWYDPIVVIIIFFLINRWITKKNTICYKKNFKLFIYLKLAGALVISLLFNLYYNGGDTTAYFNDGRLLNKVLFSNPILATEMFFNSGDKINWSNSLIEGFDGFRFANDPSTWLVCKITAVGELFTFRSMLGTAMLFGFFSARIMWRFYETMLSIYPFARRQIAFAVLFVPNVLLWGSGIFKDTITLSLTMFTFVCMYDIFKLKRKIIFNLLILAVSIYTVFVIKSYIIVTFIGSSMIWIFSLVKIKSNILRIVLKPVLILLFGIIFYFAFDQFTATFEKFSIDSVLETTKKTGEYLKGVGEKSEGSVYDIGTLTPSVPGLLKLAPAAINVTLFRPYLWESGKIIIFFSAIESTAIFLFTIFVLLKVGLFKTVFQIFKDPLLLSFIVFTLVLAIFVGLSSFNFGSLVRYKIPCIPLYLIALGVILKKHQEGLRKRRELK